MKPQQYYTDIEPIFNQFKRVDFGNSILNKYLVSIKSDTMSFSVNINNGIIEPFDIVINMINEGRIIDVHITNHDVSVKNIYLMILKNFKFTKFNNLLDFNYGKSDIFDINVSFTFDEIEYHNLLNVRRNKLLKLLKKDTDKLIIKKSSLNFNI